MWDFKSVLPTAVGKVKDFAAAPRKYSVRLLPGILIMPNNSKGGIFDPAFLLARACNRRNRQSANHTEFKEVLP